MEKQNRRCLVNGRDEATFSHFGFDIIWGSNEEPLQRSIAIVEYDDGQVGQVEPHQIKFLSKPSK